MEQNWLLPEHGGKELDDKMIALDGTPNKSGLAFFLADFAIYRFIHMYPPRN